MTKGFIDAYKSFREERFLNSAKRNIDFLLKNICTQNNSLFRNYKNDKATIFAFLIGMTSALQYFLKGAKTL